MRIGIYVGSFNPVHKGHIYVMNYLINNNYIDKIIVIPTGNYWDKNNLININDRIKMLKFYETNKIIVNSKLNNLQYTYQVLNELQKEYPSEDLYLIIGADNLEKFHLWENIDKILEHKIIVLGRDSINIDNYIKKFKQKNNFIVVTNYVEQNISSTIIRNLIKNKKLENINNYLDKKVLNYILENKLYEVIDNARKQNNND